MGSFGKGSLQKIFRKFPRNFRKLSAEFPHPFLAQWNAFLCKFPRIFRRISANFPQNPFANDPIGELLIFCLKRCFGHVCGDPLSRGFPLNPGVFQGLAAVSRHTPKGHVAPVALQLPRVSHAKLALKTCRTTTLVGLAPHCATMYAPH